MQKLFFPFFVGLLSYSSFIILIEYDMTFLVRGGPPHVFLWIICHFLYTSICWAFLGPNAALISATTGNLPLSTSLAMASSSADPTAKLYGIPNSGWTSPDWNWGYASGTGHDCAAICRRRFGTQKARSDLVEALLDPSPPSFSEPPFEETKLVLALGWQKGRWDGSDGGQGGYGEVLAAMAEAKRYETEGSEESRIITFVEDMRERFHLLNPSEEDVARMAAINMGEDELERGQRVCCGLVLKAMGFVETG